MLAAAYGPYPKAGVLGLGAAESVKVTAGWTTPERELISEFTHDQKRPPTSVEIGALRHLAERSNEVLRRMTGGHNPDRTDQADFNTAQGLINFYLVNGRGPDNKDPWAPPRGGPEIEALVKAAVSAVPQKQSLLSKIVHSPIALVVNPVDTVVKKVIGDKAYYSVAKAIGGDKVEAALRAGNDLSSHSLSDLSHGSTVKDLANQGARVAAVVAQEKLSPEQAKTVLAAVHPEAAKVAVTELKRVAPAVAPKIAELSRKPPIKTPPSAARAPGQYGPYPKGVGVAGTGVGSFLRPSARWRWFAVYANGQPVAQRGPIWLSDYDADLEAASFLESTQGRDYIGTLKRWNWDQGQWALGDPLDAPPHGGHGGHHGGGHGGGRGRPVLSRGGRGIPGWWGPWWGTTEVVTTTETCRTWGDPIEMPPEMVAPAKAAFGASGGRPVTVRGPDGGLYLLQREGSTMTARPCAATVTS